MVGLGALARARNSSPRRSCPPGLPHASGMPDAAGRRDRPGSRPRPRRRPERCRARWLCPSPSAVSRSQAPWWIVAAAADRGAAQEGHLRGGSPCLRRPRPRLDRSSARARGWSRPTASARRRWRSISRRWTRASSARSLTPRASSGSARVTSRTGRPSRRGVGHGVGQVELPLGVVGCQGAQVVEDLRRREGVEPGVDPPDGQLLRAWRRGPRRCRASAPSSSTITRPSEPGSASSATAMAPQPASARARPARRASRGDQRHVAREDEQVASRPDLGLGLGEGVARCPSARPGAPRRDRRR